MHFPPNECSPLSVEESNFVKIREFKSFGMQLMKIGEKKKINATATIIKQACCLTVIEQVP